jgi:tryptophanyl-tRNA synthetase
LGVELLVLIADYQTITDREAPVDLPQDVEGLLADLRVPET